MHVHGARHQFVSIEMKEMLQRAEVEVVEEEVAEEEEEQEKEEEKLEDDKLRKKEETLKTWM